MLSPAYDPDRRYHDDMMRDGDGMMDGGAMTVVLVALLLLVTLVALAALAGWFLHARRSPGLDTAAPGQPARAGLLLDERLARGEVSPEDYESARALLDRSR